MKNLTDIPLGWKRKLTPAQLSEVSYPHGEGPDTAVDPATVWPYPVDGKCELCGYGGSKKQLHMDHDHLTGQFRAWLCSNCNAKIAWVERVGLEAVNQFLAGSAR